MSYHKRGLDMAERALILIQPKQIPARRTGAAQSSRGAATANCRVERQQPN